MSTLVGHIDTSHPSDLCGYNGTDVDYILELLKDKDACEKLARDFSDYNQTITQNGTDTNRTSTQYENGAVRMSNNSNNVVAMDTTSGANRDHISPRHQPISEAGQYDFKSDANPSGEKKSTANVSQRQRIYRRSSGYEETAASSSASDCDDPELCPPDAQTYRKMHFTEGHDSLREIAHGLHFASIAILAFLVLEVRTFCLALLGLYIILKVMSCLFSFQLAYGFNRGIYID